MSVSTIHTVWWDRTAATHSSECSLLIVAMHAAPADSDQQQRIELLQFSNDLNENEQ